MVPVELMSRIRATATFEFAGAISAAWWLPLCDIAGNESRGLAGGGSVYR
jgi:hypothetical protein